MTAAEIKVILDGMFLVRALWWFIENRQNDEVVNAEIFFYLRERVRQHEHLQK